MASRWFSDYLGLHCRLYRVHQNARRLADPQRVAAWRQRNPELAGFPEEHLVSFVDGFPLLITNQASLEDLNRHLAARDHPPVGMSRFRPNIVIQGLAAYEEDYVSHLRLGALTLALVKRCTRCAMPDVDPATGLFGNEPMATLRSYRNFETGTLFGVNAVMAGTQADTVMSVGDRLEAVLDI